MKSEIENIVKKTPAGIAKQYGISYPAAVRLQKELQDYRKKSIRKDITAMLQAQNFDAQAQTRRHRVTLDRLANYNAETTAHLLEIKTRLDEVNEKATSAATFATVAAITATGTFITFILFALLP